LYRRSRSSIDGTSYISQELRHVEFEQLVVQQQFFVIRAIKLE
jgi:hypothetical protein